LRVQQSIQTKVAEALAPVHLDVINESAMHSVPPGSESHFKLVIVSDKFSGLTRVKRHQTVNGILEKELREDLHALSMETLTTEEWEQRHGRTFDSPACLGGGKADAT
jgi:stress-induced morphogen